MPKEALRSILPVAGVSAARADSVTFTGGTDPILPTPFRIGVAGAATLAATGLAAADLWETAHRAPPVRGGRCAAGHRVAAQRPLHEAGRWRGVAPAQLDHGRVSHQGWPLELPALQLPQPSRRRAERARGGGGPRRSGEGGVELERRRSRGSDHRRQGCRRHGANEGRVGTASAERRHRRPAACWRSCGSATARRSRCPPAIGRCRVSACWT